MTTEPPAAETPRRKWFTRHGSTLGWCVGAFYLFLRAMNLDPFFPVLNVDASWVYTLHDAWRSGVVFGRDIVFTYGPYGFVATEAFHPRTYPVMLALQAVILLGLVLGLARIDHGPAKGWVVLAALVMLAEGLLARVAETVGWAMLWVTLIHGVESSRDDETPGQRRRGVSVACLLGFCCALVSLMKFTYLVACAGVLGVIGVDAIARRRRTPWECVSAAVSVLALWLAAGQPIDAWGDYLAWSWEVADGYSSAMGRSGPARELFLFASAAVSLVVAGAVGRWSERRGWTLWPVAGSLGFFFVVFKSAFVRQDSLHAPTAVGVLVAAGVVTFAAVRWGRMTVAMRRALAGLAALWIVGVIGLAASVLADPDARMEPPTPGVIARSLPSNAGGVIDALRGSPNLRAKFDASCEKLRAAHPLSIDGESSDIYNNEQILLIAHGARRGPRPIPQSYIAFTPRLAELNAAHLDGPRAPRVIFLNTDTVDLRLAAMNDGPSWIGFLRWYDADPLPPAAPNKPGPHWLRMRRRDTPRSVKLDSLGTLKVAVGAPVNLPPSTAGHTMYLTLDLPPSTRGRIQNVLLRPPEVFLDLQQRDGFTPRTRFIPGAGRAGFVVSPLVTDPSELGALLAAGGAATQPRPNDVTAIRLWIEESDRDAYENEASITLYRVVVTPE